MSSPNVPANRLSRLPRLLAPVIAGLIAPAAMADSFFYSYFKDPVPLAVDQTRLAVFSNAQAPDLQPFGIPPDALSDHVVSGWSIASLTNLAGGFQAMPEPIQLAGQLVAANAADFVSPVFLDPRGLPVIVTRDILVRFADGVTPDQARALLADHEAGDILESDKGGIPGLFRIRTRLTSGIDVLNLANMLADRPDVEFAEPDAIFTSVKHLTPNDSNYNLLWGLHNTGQSGGTPDMDMDAPEAWDISTGNSSIIVVVLDDGVQTNHPDMVVAHGEDFTGNFSGGNPVNNCDDHGTAVAGSIRATMNNNLGVVGICPNCSLAAARVSISNVPCNGQGTYQPSWFVDALAWADTIGARVTNTSSGFGVASSITSAYSTAVTNGIVHFVSSGNSGTQGIEYPAYLASVNAVGAINRNGNRASFSTYGPELEFVAPGQSVYTTDRTGTLGYAGGSFTFVDGTSFSSPYAAGVAGLILSVRPELSPYAVAQIMKDTCVDRGATGFDNFFGYGIINARAALLIAPTYVPPTPADFDLLLPADGANIQILNPLLDWAPATGASNYTVVLSTKPDLSDPLFTLTVPVSQLQLSNGTLQIDTTYYWQVRANNTFGPTFGAPFVSTFNTNTTPPPPECPGDANGDGSTNGADLSVLLANFGLAVTPNTSGDVNGDGLVNGSDLSVLLANFGCQP